MKAKTTLAWLGLLVCSLPAWAIADHPLADPRLRRGAVDDPQGVIAEVRQRLDNARGALPAKEERDLLWWMGSAALNAGDDAAFAEAALRLDSLAASRNDTVASAEAGFLRAGRDIASGSGEGLGRALAAAASLQGNEDPSIVAWSKYQLCDAYTQVEDAHSALPLCHEASRLSEAVGDAWQWADAENNEAQSLAGLNRPTEAANLYERSMRRFRSVGAHQVAAMVGDNLARTYLTLGRASEALALSSASLANEQAAGRVNDALLSRANIARAYAAMKRPADAYRQIKAAVADARAAGYRGMLPDLLQTESAMAQDAGDTTQALASLREANGMLLERRAPGIRSNESSLEARYVTREKEVRIRDLERENELQEFALKSAEAQTERQRATRNLLALAVFAALLLTGLLTWLLRVQRRHAAEMRQQALRDPLTGVDNRRAFLLDATQLIHAPVRADALPHVLMLIDFDHFKRINDSVGHPMGDVVLGIVVDYLRQATEGIARVARLGGEEFSVLYPNGGAAQGVRLAESLRAGVAALVLPAEVQTNITVSIGLALFDRVRCTDLDSWMRVADSALYSAKAHGRDRVVASSMMPDSPASTPG